MRTAEGVTSTSSSSSMNSSACSSESFTGGVAKVILAHELTHALDDQLYGLDDDFDAIETVYGMGYRWVSD